MCKSFYNLKLFTLVEKKAVKKALTYKNLGLKRIWGGGSDWAEFV